MITPSVSRPEWANAYLTKLGIADPGTPSLDALRALHRAHVGQVAFENIDIQLGRPQGIDPVESVGRILRGRGGYCYNLNGAFAALLDTLGYQVTRHVGQVNGSAAGAKKSPAEYGSHLALTVLLDGARWSVDVGLGNALYEPIPLTPGPVVQGPYTFGLAGLPEIGPDAWRFLSDPAQKSWHSMDFTLAPAQWRDFADHHLYLSTSPLSGFVKTCELYRRDATGTDFVLGDVLVREEGGGHRTERLLASTGEWFQAAADVFRLDLSALDQADRTALWDRIQRAQQERQAKASGRA